MSNNVLFLGHDASRTGAPLLLLEMIKWISNNTKTNCYALLKRGGALISEYKNACPSIVFSDELKAHNSRISSKLYRKLGRKHPKTPDLLKMYPPTDYPIVYANTIATTDLAMEFALNGRKLIHHIHELSYTTDFFGARDALMQSASITDCYIAASWAVKSFLVNEIGASDAKVQVIHEFPIINISNQEVGNYRQSIRKLHNIPNDAFVVGMVGLPQWRKGVDIFVQLARLLIKKHAFGKIHFFWIGGDEQSLRELTYDAERLGLREICHLIPAVDNPVPYFRAFDIFALTSREDPFPVVMLEAAANGLPIVCFADSGGAVEFVEDDAGIIVPYLDVVAMSNACEKLYLDSTQCKKYGVNAKSKVDLNYQLKYAGPKIYNLLQNI
jgi:glycosyltransferase involved in cell wall biosynthesis